MLFSEIEEQAKIVLTEQSVKKEKKEPEEVYPEGFEPIPMNEPDLSLLPKKSALKGMGGGDGKHGTPVSRDKNDNHSHVNFSHIDEITTPQISNVIRHPSPKPSPKSTPLSSARPKLRGGLP